jgi:hypothetical protein
LTGTRIFAVEVQLRQGKERGREREREGERGREREREGERAGERNDPAVSLYLSQY